MNKLFTDLLRKTRKCANLTVERASELLFLSPRALHYYEAGRRNIPDDVVARMVEIYRSPTLGYVWLSKELITGRILLPANPFLNRKKPSRLAFGTACRKDLQLLN